MTLGSAFRVLIVEDEILLAMELQSIIEDAGHQVVGHVRFALDPATTPAGENELEVFTTRHDTLFGAKFMSG